MTFPGVEHRNFAENSRVEDLDYVITAISPFIWVCLTAADTILCEEARDTGFNED